MITARKQCEEEEKEVHLVLRLYNPNKLWTKGRCQNEVAIMSYLKKHSNLPVPTIHSYSYEKSKNILRCEYILMDRLPGIPLSELTFK